MGIFDFFNRDRRNMKVALMQSTNDGYFTFKGNLYHGDIVDACVNPYAAQIGKLIPVHVGEGKNYGYIDKILTEPNPLMSFQDLLEKLAWQLALNNNAFAQIIRTNGRPVEIYPIDASNVESKFMEDGLYLQFLLRKTGDTVLLPYSDVIHLRKKFKEDTVFGTAATCEIENLMEMVGYADQSLKVAIKSGQLIKYLLKLSTVLRDGDVEAKAKAMQKSYLDGDMQIMAVGAGCEVQPLNNNSYVPNPLQNSGLKARTYDYFGVCEDIVQSKFNEDTFNAYYENQIEPVAIKLSEEMTRKCFTFTERQAGHKICFGANNLMYASMQTKLQLASMVNVGAMSLNEWRGTMFLPPIENGDTFVRRLDTATV